MHTQAASYETFELTIGPPSPEGYPLTVTGAPGGDGAGFCRIVLDDELADTLDAVEQGDVDADFLTQIGTILFEDLFVGDIGELYRSSVGITRGQQSNMRVRLHINAPELAALPWEYLHDPGEESFLATSPETPLVRYIPVRMPARPTKVALPLRILLLIANPTDTPQLDIAQERQIMESALSQWIDDGQIQLEVVEKATVANVAEAMRRVAPHVVHFSGHGFFEAGSSNEGTAYIVLENDDGTAAPMDEKSFREFFSGCKETRLAVLNACQSATLSTAKPLVGIAPQLLQRQLSAVVAMQYPVSDHASLIFTREFYRSLALGYPVDAAISEARKGIFMEMGGQSREWGTPVLFMRAKDGLLFEIDEPEQPSIEIPPPPEPRRPPEIQGFVGREAELTAYAETLEETSIAVITGMAGAGKTALAAQLTHWVAEPERVFWHSFNEGDGVDSIISSLAGFLAWHGKAELWQLLRSAELSGGQPPPTDTLFDYVIQLVRGANYLLCLDDFQFVDDDPDLNQLVDRLREVLRAKELSMILTARRVPDFVALATFESLPGLSCDDARRLLLTNNVRLSDEQIDALYKHTDGNAQFLTLAIEALRQAKDPDDLIEGLAASRDIKRYLMYEVDELLTGRERNVMNVVAILLGRPGTRDVIDAILQGPNIFRDLSRLTDRHLLITQESDKGREYLQHSMVQEFYYQEAGPSQRKRMHNRAGQHYRDEEQDLLRAGIHYERAGAMTEAAQVATQDVLRIINQGEIRPLRTLLERFVREQLDPKLWIEVNLAKGQIYVLQAEQEEGKVSLQEAIDHINSVEKENEQILLKARAYRGMGELLERSLPPEALEWLEKGLDVLAASDQLEAAILHIRSGTIQFFLSQYEDSLQSSQKGMKLLPDGPSQWRTRGLVDMSSVYFNQGKYQQAIKVATEAIEMCNKLSDPINQIPAFGNLAISKFSTGDIQGGFATLEEAALLANYIGNDAALAQLEMNLGTAHFSTGELDQAKGHLHKSIEIAKKHDNKRIHLFALRNLIDLHVDEEEWGIARQHLEEAEPLARTLDDQHNLMTLFGHWSEVALAEDDGVRALEYANRRWGLAVELEEVVQQGISQAYLGKTLAATGQHEDAFTAFERSLDLIADKDPYQVALTKMDWGKALLAAERQDEGIEMLVVSRNELRDLEDLDLVKKIDELLAAHDVAGRSMLRQEMK